MVKLPPVLLRTIEAQLEQTIQASKKQRWPQLIAPKTRALRTVVYQARPEFFADLIIYEKAAQIMPRLRSGQLSQLTSLLTDIATRENNALRSVGVWGKFNLWLAALIGNHERQQNNPSQQVRDQARNDPQGNVGKRSAG